MKFINTYSIRPGCLKAAAERFLTADVAPPPGVTLLGRWHATDLSGGWALVEVENPAAAYSFALQWGDVLEMSTHPVVEDEHAGAALGALYGAAGPDR